MIVLILEKRIGFMTLIFMNLNNLPFVKYSHLTPISYLLSSSGSLHDAALLLWPQRTSYFRTVVFYFFPSFLSLLELKC